MNIDNIDSKIFDQLVTDYYTGMYESQYDKDFPELTMEEWEEYNNEVARLKEKETNSTLEEDIPF